eukprot:947047-Amphidinium_carterae.1
MLAQTSNFSEREIRRRHFAIQRALKAGVSSLRADMPLVQEMSSTFALKWFEEYTLHTLSVYTFRKRKTYDVVHVCRVIGVGGGVQ